MITGKTKLLGVIGHPIEHSLSPIMHNAAIRAMAAVSTDTDINLDYIYLPFLVEPKNLEPALAGLSAIGVQGFNVTIPHKQAILPLISELSAIAQAVGAVNTIYCTERGWAGTNTDVAGFLAPLKAHPQDWKQATVLILGNGGAARAVVAGCAQLNCAQVQVVGRNIQKLQEFLESWTKSRLKVNLSIHLWSELPNLLPHVDLLVNTTPIGMRPQVDASPLNWAEIKKLSAGAIAYDLIYTPRPTRFLQQAEEQGAIAINGLEMLVQQGAAALELWLGQPAPVDVMRQALNRYLGGGNKV
jgi:shikimate dehydrogenase